MVVRIAMDSWQIIILSSKAWLFENLIQWGLFSLPVLSTMHVDDCSPVSIFHKNYIFIVASHLIFIDLRHVPSFSFPHHCLDLVPSHDLRVDLLVVVFSLSLLSFIVARPWLLGKFSDANSFWYSSNRNMKSWSRLKDQAVKIGTESLSL